MKTAKEKKSPEGLSLKFRVFTKNKFAVIGFFITLFMILFAIFGRFFTPNYDLYTLSVTDRLSMPSAEHFFGTDTMGRDLYSRCVHGIGVSLYIGLMVSVLSSVLGVLMGLLAGYFRLLDNIIMRICEALMSVPAILLALVLMAIFDPNVNNVIVALSIIYTPSIARVARASTLSVREQTYIEACRSIGAKWSRILFRHILPNIISPIIVQATFIFASSIIVESSLSFIGVGVPAPEPSLGNILFDAKSVLLKDPMMTFIPGLIMILLVLGVNLLGDGMRDVLDPQSN